MEKKFLKKKILFLVLKKVGKKVTGKKNIHKLQKYFFLFFLYFLLSGHIFSPNFLSHSLKIALWPPTYVRAPNQQRWYAKCKLSRNMYTLYTRFYTFGPDFHAESVISNKISASELSRKFIKSALLVG